MKLIAVLNGLFQSFRHKIHIFDQQIDGLLGIFNDFLKNQFPLLIEGFLADVIAAQKTSILFEPIDGTGAE